jgi:hypothetical protein
MLTTIQVHTNPDLKIDFRLWNNGKSASNSARYSLDIKIRSQDLSTHELEVWFHDTAPLIDLAEKLTAFLANSQTVEYTR